MTRAKVILIEVHPSRMGEYEGNVLYRRSGPVKILKVQPRSTTYEFIGTSTEEQSYKLEGFYKPVLFIVDRDIYWNGDNCYKELRPSQHEQVGKYLQRTKNELYYIGIPLVRDYPIIKFTLNEIGDVELSTSSPKASRRPKLYL